MDDPPTSPLVQLTVSRCCETSRLQGQLLARAYQHLYPEVRRPLVDPLIGPLAMAASSAGATAAQVAAGA
jgi:hypothetical protein